MPRTAQSQSEKLLQRKDMMVIHERHVSELRIGMDVDDRPRLLVQQQEVF